MAHRKPIGSLTSPMYLDWHGDKPQLGEYLRSAAGTWYRVAGDLETANPAKVKLVLERITGPDEPARVHELWWYPRDRRAA